MANLKLNLFLLSLLLLAGSASQETFKPKRLNYSNGFNYLKNMKRLLKENDDLKKEMEELKRTGLQEFEELKIKFELMNRSMEFQLRAYDLQSSKIDELQEKDLILNKYLISDTDFINKIITNKDFLSAIEKLIPKKGPAADVGPPGPPGLPGKNGEKGTQGENGLDGGRGEPGEKGSKGDQGEQSPVNENCKLCEAVPELMERQRRVGIVLNRMIEVWPSNK